jgi:16S rRNA (guanine966-N2)-methyltransferase
MSRLRIIGGRHGGRVFRLPAGTATRPTADRVREALFNILAHGIDWPGLADVRVIDVFAGSGAYGLEALSRGAAGATFIDREQAALLAIRRNAASLGEAPRVTLLQLDATHLPPPPFAAGAPCALAFLDPPYGSGAACAALAGLASRGWLADGGLAVVEVGAREPFVAPPAFAVIDERSWGAARVLFYRFGNPRAA